MGKRRCQIIDGVRVYGAGKVTEQDRAEIALFKRFLRGEMNPGEVRAYAGLSLGQAAKILGITRETCARWVKGYVRAMGLLCEGSEKR